MKFGSLVWLLWQSFHRLKNDINCQAIVDILTKFHRNVTKANLYQLYDFRSVAHFYWLPWKPKCKKKVKKNRKQYLNYHFLRNNMLYEAETL